jgi:hypothetical protein
MLTRTWKAICELVCGQQDPSWHSAYISGPVRGIDGETSSSYVRRRWVKGTAQYRKETLEEEPDDIYEHLA